MTAVTGDVCSSTIAKKYNSSFHKSQICVHMFFVVVVIMSTSVLPVGVLPLPYSLDIILSFSILLAWTQLATLSVFVRLYCA